jgi:hypothetical protein
MTARATGGVKPPLPEFEVEAGEAVVVGAAEFDFEDVGAAGLDLAADGLVGFSAGAGDGQDDAESALAGKNVAVGGEVARRRGLGFRGEAEEPAIAHEDGELDVVRQTSNDDA